MKRKGKKNGKIQNYRERTQSRVRNIEIGDQVEKRPYVVMTYLPNGTYHKLKRKCDKAGINLVTRPGRKLKDILCAPNKTRHDPKDKPGIYRLRCKCSPKAQYIGQTIRPINVRAKEHERAANNGNWNHSGISQHKKDCPLAVDWEPEVIVSMMNKTKNKLTYDLKVREALEIRRHNCGPGSGLNEDFGAYVKTHMWDPVFHKMNNESGRGEGANP